MNDTALLFEPVLVPTLSTGDVVVIDKPPHKFGQHSRCHRGSRRNAALPAALQPCFNPRMNGSCG